MSERRRIRHGVLVVAGLTALAIIPCIILIRAERAARAARRPTRRAPGGGRLLAEGSGMSAATGGDRAEAPVQLGRAFKGAIAAMRRMRGRETHRPGELSDAQYGLLFGLRDHELSARELAFAADVSPATAAEMLEGLAAAGLVSRVRSESDRRVVLTSLTDRGRELVQARQARYEPRWRAALGGLQRRGAARAAASSISSRGLFDEFAEERQP